MCIVETLAGQFFFVKDCDSADLAHCWDGIAVKRMANGWQTKANAKPILVRKEGCKVIA